MIKQNVLCLRQNSSQNANKILFLLLSLSFILLVSTSAVAQDNTTTQNVPTPSQMQKDAEAQGISSSDLQRLGIDLSKPTDALNRARELGIPEYQIQSYLDQYQAQSPSLDELKTPEVTEITGTILEESANEKQNTEDDIEEGEIEEEESDSLQFLGKDRFAGLEYFGYSTLYAGRGNFSALEVGPVDPGYVISSGDILRIYLWGDVEFQSELTVDRNGNITIPKAGQFFAAGTRLESLRENLKNYLSKYYSGLATDPLTIFMDVSIARVRGNQIYLMGEVQRPGSYNISSFATTFNLMYSTGGPRLSGSLRDVRILRNGKIESSVDFYDYMLKGNSTDDKRLQNNDIVFIPQRGKTVAVNGEVIRPGIYEMKEGEDLNSLLEFAGGTSRSAYSFRIQIDRIIPLAEREKGGIDREMIDINLDDVFKKKSQVKLKDGDLVTVFPYNDILLNYVDIYGIGITRPGRYELAEDGTKLRDIIFQADSLTGDAYLFKADIVRTLPDATQKFLTIDINKALANDPEHNIDLWPLDVIRIYSRLDWNESPTISLRGFSKNTGDFLLPNNKTLFDILFEYSGLQDSLQYARVYKDKVDILRLNSDGKRRFIITKNLDDVWNHVDGSNIELIDKDIVILYENTIEEVYKPEVTISGHVKQPGTFDLTEGMSLADLLRMADGFTDDAWVLEAEISRVNMMGFAGETLAEVIHVPLAEWDGEIDNPELIVPSIFREDSEASNFILKPSDHIRIRNNPDYERPGVVTIEGEVIFPGSYTLQKDNETLSELIKRAGGLTSIAHSEGGQFYRNDVRLFLDYHQLLIKGDKREDVVLHPGDRINIPKRPNSVAVFGEVNNIGLYKFIDGKKAKSYIKEAGGLTDNAGQAYIIYPSGRTYKITWRKNPKVIDGAVIRVLPKPPEEEKEPIDWTGIIKDTLAILASAATIIAVVDRI